HQVYIKNSKHTPLPKEALLDAMEAYFNCLINEPVASVRAVLGHFIFVFIHPYMDGNGRIGRFIMNSLFAAGGFPWIIIPVAHRSDYFQALEKASVEGDIKPFTQFILGTMNKKQ
ncbi:MAG TPA: Fic family protein, partial [Gammaproteobacteria bacterium]|nr:Fic family protein [Gammaproteobacteria bacterium]